jgi:hypothetical protein
VKLAEILGLHAAVYVSELMNINDKAIKKNKLDNDRFTLVREYIQSRTTLDVQEQLEIEENLLKLGILEKGESSDSMSLNINTLAVLMMGTDEQLIDKAKKTKKKSGRPTKAEAIRQNLKDGLRATNVELREAYEAWIDAVFDKQGWMSKKCVTVAEDTIDSFTNRNLDIALRVLEIASIHGYRDIQWAINKYNEEFRVSYSTRPTVRKVVTANSQLSNEVF